jgi:hypothetical protein
MSIGSSSSTRGLVVKPLKPAGAPARAPEPDAPAPPAPGPSAAPTVLILVVSLLLLVVGVLASQVLRREMSRLLSEADEQAFARANLVLTQTLDDKRDRALANVKVLVDETRVRATVVTPNFDEATVTDVLDDLRIASGATVLAVLNVAGKVQARSGADVLQQLDLGSVKAVKAALDNPTAAVWTLPERVLVIALAPIRSGAGVASLLMIGFEVGSATLDAIERLDGLLGAVVIGDRVVATASRDSGASTIFATARSLPEAGGTLPAAGKDWLIKSARIGESALAARVLWALPWHHRAEGMAGLFKVAWAPTILVGMMLALVAISVRRR